MNRFTLFSFAAVLLSSVFYYFTYPEVDPDLWGHIFFGREIVEKGSIPSLNLYSYTAPEYRWINHEWLAEVIFAIFYSLTGSPGLIALKLAIGVFTVWSLDHTLRGKGISLLPRAIALVWAMALLSPGFNIRPQIFTYFLFAIFLLLFYRYEQGQKRALYWLPVLLILWVNLHGGFVAGLGALGVFCFWTAVSEYRRGVPIQPLAMTLGLPFGIAVCCLLINPYGLELLRFVAADLLLDRPITEWKPIPLLSFSFLEVKLAVVFIFFFLRRRSMKRWDAALVILAILFAFRHQRHTPLLALAAVPFLASGLDRMLAKLQGGIGANIIGLTLLGLAFVQLYDLGIVRRDHGLELVVKPTRYPSQAVTFLAQNDVRGNLALPFDWGQYAIWKLYPNVRVSIDGRFTTAYPMEVIEDNWDWMRGGKDWRTLLDRYPTDVVLSSRYHPVTKRLGADPGWVYIYSDPTAFIFVRNSPSQEKLIARFQRKELTIPDGFPLYFPG